MKEPTACDLPPAMLHHCLNENDSGEQVERQAKSHARAERFGVDPVHVGVPWFRIVVLKNAD